MVWLIEERELSVRTQPPKITTMINLLTINLMAAVRAKRKYLQRTKEERRKINIVFFVSFLATVF